MKPYPKYKDSGVEWIGKMPEGWSILRLKWVCNFLYGESLSAQEREDGTIPVYGSNGIVGYHNRSITEKPCIIVGRKGSFGKVTFSKKKCYPIDTTYYIDCTSTKKYMRWLWYLLPLLKMDKFSRDSAVPGLNREDAYRNIVTLPSSYEQKQIAAYLDRKTIQIDDLISTKQKLIELLKEERAAIINQAVTKGLNPDAPMKDSGIEWLGEVPEHWEVKKLKYVSIIISKGTTPSTIGKDITARGEIRFIKAENIENNNLKPKPAFFVDEKTNDILKRSQLEKYDILFVIAGATIGKVAVLTDEFLPANTNQAISFIRLKPYVNVKFIWYWLQSSRINELTWLNAVQSAQPNLSMENLGNFCVTYPTGSQQDEIVFQIESETTKIDQTITKIKKQIDLLKEYRTALISNVVTGKIDVRT